MLHDFCIQIVWIVTWAHFELQSWLLTFLCSSCISPLYTKIIIWLESDTMGSIEKGHLISNFSGRSKGGVWLWGKLSETTLSVLASELSEFEEIQYWRDGVNACLLFSKGTSLLWSSAILHMWRNVIALFLPFAITVRYVWRWYFSKPCSIPKWWHTLQNLYESQLIPLCFDSCRTHGPVYWCLLQGFN